MTRAEQIGQYLAMGFDLIPLDGKAPIPGITWAGEVKYNGRPLDRKGVADLFRDNPDANVGIICGRRSGIIVVDFDVLGEQDRILGDLGLPTDTATVQTGRGLHFYYRIDRHLAIQKKGLPGSDREEHGHLLGDGQYVVAPPSIHETGRVYAFLDGRDLGALKDVSKTLTGKILTAPRPTDPPGQGVLPPARTDPPRPPAPVRHFNVKSFAIRKGLSCVQQLFDRQMVVGEREKLLHLLYNLMICNGDAVSYAQGVIMRKNASLVEPLPDQDLRKCIFSGKIYPHRCLRTIEKAPFINCDGCGFAKTQEEQMRLGWASDPVALNGRRSGVEHAIYNGISAKVFDLNTPHGQIAKLIGVSRSAVIRGIKKLEKDGLLQPILPESK